LSFILRADRSGGIEEARSAHTRIIAAWQLAPAPRTCTIVELGEAGKEVVNIFELDRALLGDYERFARSFTQIRAQDIGSQIEALYASNRFWPAPLISIDPHFERGPEIDRLAVEAIVHPNTARVDHPIRAVAKSGGFNGLSGILGIGALGKHRPVLRGKFAGSR
jgi:hypothetical protein